MQAHTSKAKSFLQLTNEVHLVKKTQHPNCPFGGNYKICSFLGGGISSLGKNHSIFHKAKFSDTAALSTALTPVYGKELGGQQKSLVFPTARRHSWDIYPGNSYSCLAPCRYKRWLQLQLYHSPLRGAVGKPVLQMLDLN